MDRAGVAMTDRTPTSDPVAAAWEAMRRDRRYSASGDLDGVIAAHRPLIEEAIRQQARAAFAAQVRAAVEAKKLRGADFTTRWGHGFDDAIRSVLFTLDALLAASPEPASPEALGSGLREALLSSPDVVAATQGRIYTGPPGNRLDAERLARALTRALVVPDAETADRDVVNIIREYDRLAARPDGAEADAAATSELEERHDA